MTLGFSHENRKIVATARVCFGPTAVVGVFLDENKDGVSEAGETMAYTATFQNTGNVRVGNVTIAHSLEQAALLCDEGFQEATSCNVRKSKSNLNTTCKRVEEAGGGVESLQLTLAVALVVASPV